MRLLLPIFLLIVLTLPNLAFAEIKTITHTVQQPFGGSQSPDDARTAGIARAKREALERFGTYIESATVVKNAQVDSDEILALTAGVTKAEVIKQKNYTDGDGFGLEITVKVELDTAVLDKSLKQLLQDRNHLKDLKAAREREKQLLSRITELEKQNQQKENTENQKLALEKEFQKTRDGLTAVGLFDKATELWNIKKYNVKKYKETDITKEIEYFSQAIQLDPSYALAYNNRGIAYAHLKQYQQAIADFSQAILLEPSAAAYNNRGLVYSELKQYQQAFSDYNEAIRHEPSYMVAYENQGNAYQNLKQHHQAINVYNHAIRLDPSYASAYSNRGNSYMQLKQYQNAFADFNQAIRLDPSNAAFYNNRGYAYAQLKQYQQAISDYNQAMKLDSDLALTYLNRGNAYRHLEQYQQAIKDYTQATKLEPGYAAAYNNLGLTHILSKDTVQGCLDLNKACSLGDCNGYNFTREKGMCK